MLVLTAGVAAIMAGVGLAGTQSCGGAGSWALPLNTVLLIALAFIQQRHYKRTAQVERIVDQRKRVTIPPPDHTYKRSGDPDH